MWWLHGQHFQRPTRINFGASLRLNLANPASIARHATSPAVDATAGNGYGRKLFRALSVNDAYRDGFENLADLQGGALH